MGQIANYPNGFAYGLNVRGMPLSQSHPGKVFWVGNSTVLMDNQKAASNGNDGSFLAPYSTVDYAIGRCLANRGDVIFVKPGHAETLDAASDITSDVAGVTIIGLGTGAKRPTFTWSTDTAATWVVSADNVTIQNIIGICNIDALVKAFSVTGSGVHLDLEWQDQTDIEAERVVLTTAAADKLSVNLRYLGYTGGNACVAPIQLVGTNGARINLDFYGKASTAVVNMITTASTDVEVTGTVYVSGTTNGSKNVVDTQGSSTWYMDVIDAAAGARYTGGSAVAVASDDISTITTRLGTEAATDPISEVLSGTAGITTWKTSAAPATGVSMSEVLRAVYDNVSGVDGSTNVLGVDDADNGFASTSVAANRDGSVLERLEAIYAAQVDDVAANAIGIDDANNVFASSSVVANANGSLLERDEALQVAAAPSSNHPNYFTVTADMTSATWNTVAAHEIATVTGMVRMQIIVEVTATVITTGTNGTIALGFEGNTSAIFSATALDAALTGDVFSAVYGSAATTVASGAEAQSSLTHAIFDVVVVTGKDVGYTIATNAATTGTLTFHVWWQPLDSTGAVTAGAGGVL